jgi:hypothetical protein
MIRIDWLVRTGGTPRKESGHYGSGDGSTSLGGSLVLSSVPVYTEPEAHLGFGRYIQGLDQFIH